MMIQIEIDLTALHKAESIGRPGLVKRKVKVHRGGKVFEQYRWVKAGVDEPAEKKPSAEELTPKPKKGLAIMGLNKPEKEDFAHKVKVGDIVNLAGRITTVKSVDKENETVTLTSPLDSNEMHSFEDLNMKGVLETPEGKFKEEEPKPEWIPPSKEKAEVTPKEEKKIKSVKQAKEAMESHIDNLEVTHEGKDLLDGIREYTGGDFKRFNSYLRSGKISHRAYKGKVSLIKPSKKQKKEIDEEMTKVSDFLKDAPKMEGKVYRGMVWGQDRKSIKAFDEFISQMNLGSMIEFPTFSSTSSDKNVAMDFATKAKYSKAVVIEMKSKTGVYLDGTSAFKNEHEVLFDRDSKFTVATIDKDSDPIRISLKEM